jgi:hypothetical protein
MSSERADRISIRTSHKHHYHRRVNKVEQSSLSARLDRERQTAHRGRELGYDAIQGDLWDAIALAFDTCSDGGRRFCLQLLVRLNSDNRIPADDIIVFFAWI